MAIGHSKPINVDKYEIGDWGGRGKEKKRGRNEKETNREEAESPHRYETPGPLGSMQVFPDLYQTVDPLPPPRTHAKGLRCNRTQSIRHC